MTTTPADDPQMFELLKTIADRDSLDITDEEIRYGHHRIEGYAWLAEHAYRLGATRERDAARAELAKTRADVEKLTTALDIVALREIRQAADLAIVERERDRLRDSVQRARQEIAALRAEVGNAKARISAAATVEVWTNEDGKRFVFADDLMRALDTNPEANPATTAEPADEPKATCSCKWSPVQGRIWCDPCAAARDSVLDAAAKPDAEPAAS